MPRRKAYTEVEKRNEMRPSWVDGKSDVVYRRFECMSPTCHQTIVALEEECTGDFSIKCPACEYVHFAGGSLHLFDYTLVDKTNGDVINEGPFAPTHDAYVGGAERVKYCLYCYTMQPLSNFHQHARQMNSGRQGECRMCKKLYNALKNESRLAEQHREAAENRRLLSALSGETKVESIADLLDRFEHSCFNCSKSLKNREGGTEGYHLDHTLPVSWLWPLNHGPTILCADCNGRKSDHWPSEFYTRKQLRELSARTGIEFKILSGKPFFNPVAVERLRKEADAIIERWIPYPDKLKNLSTRILAATGEDVFRDARPESLRAIKLDPEP
jgi:hypothetical protein